MPADIKELAIEIADEAAAMDLCSHSRPCRIDGHNWIDTDLARGSADDLGVVERAMRYLSARGMLLRHPSQPNLVRTKPATQG